MAEIINIINNADDFIDIANKLSIDDLEKVIIYTTDRYYYSSSPIITDEKYDTLIDLLILKNPKSKILKNIGSKVKTKNKIKLDYWLGSMNKIKPFTKELNNWILNYNESYNISDKLDGISALLIYDNNSPGNIKLFTRGTADEGIEITNLIKYLKIPDYSFVKNYCIKNNIKGDKNLIAFRGELIIKSIIFYEKWSKIFKNGRNMIGGLVNSKKINPNIASDTDLVLYEVVDPFTTINKQLEIIQKLKFNIVFNKNIKTNLTYEFLSEYLNERRNNSIYKIDGIIITAMNNNVRNIKGNPEYAFAYKDISEDQIAKTKIINIEWNISKNGNIIPTIIVEPVIIGGVEIKRTSGFNAKYIFDNNLGPDSIIELIRSGDVIPNIKTIISSSIKPQMPENIDWYWDGFDIKINNLNNIDFLIKNIHYFFSSLDTKGLGEKNIKKLVNNGFNSIIKIINIKKEELINIDGVKDKLANNILNSLNKTFQKSIPLYKLMNASNMLGEGIGIEKIKLIIDNYPDIIYIHKKWNENEFIDNIVKIKGFDIKTASLFVSNFHKFIKFFNEIKNNIATSNITTTTTSNTSTSNSGKLHNKIIVFSGFRNSKLEEIIINNGGIINNNVTKKTNYLIIKNNLSSGSEKIKKADELGIIILTVEKFYEQFNL